MAHKCQDRASSANCGRQDVPGKGAHFWPFRALQRPKLALQSQKLAPLGQSGVRVFTRCVAISCFFKRQSDVTRPTTGCAKLALLTISRMGVSFVDLGCSGTSRSPPTRTPVPGAETHACSADSPQLLIFIGRILGNSSACRRI
jgi:hypothetical protein